MKAGYKLIIIALFSFLVIIPCNFAQEKLKDKINKIDGSVDKIVITADGKDFSFEGNEAKELFKKIKKSTSQNFNWTTSDSTNGKEKIFIIKTDNDEKEIEVETEGENKIIIKTDKDFDEIEGIKKKEKVEVENGNKKVTVTTIENGEEKTEVYEGKEADEYIEKMKSENDDFNISIDKGNNGKKIKKIIIETEKEEKK